MFWKKKENVYQLLTIAGLKPGDHFFMPCLKTIVECKVKKIKYDTSFHTTFIEYEKAFLCKWPEEKISYCTESKILDSLELYRTLNDCMKRQAMPKTLFDVEKFLEQNGWEIEKRRKEHDLLWHYRWDGIGAVKEAQKMNLIQFRIDMKGLTVMKNLHPVYKTKEECEKANKVEIVRFESFKR